MTSASDQDFSEPVPREAPAVYNEFVWPAGAVLQLKPGPSSLPIDLAGVLQERQSARASAALPLEELAALLWLTVRTHTRRDSPFGFQQHFRPHPSAGAMHPIHVLCQLASGEPWRRYEPVAHALVEVTGTEALAAGARSKAAELLRAREGILLALVAEPGKTSAKYENAGSLVWRDSGVVIGYLSLVAAAMKLAFCPLGLTGNCDVRPIAPDGVLDGVGLAVVGAQLPASD